MRTFDTVEDLRVALLELKGRYHREWDGGAAGRIAGILMARLASAIHV